MKAHDKDTVTAFNALINKLMLFNIEKRSKGEEMSDADYVQILKKTQKELFEEKDAFEKAGRADTVLSLNNQIAAIEKYLPKMMSEDEIRAVIMTLPDKSVPSVMRHFKAEYATVVFYCRNLKTAFCFHLSRLLLLFFTQLSNRVTLPFDKPDID